MMMTTTKCFACMYEMNDHTPHVKNCYTTFIFGSLLSIIFLVIDNALVLCLRRTYNAAHTFVAPCQWLKLGWTRWILFNSIQPPASKPATRYNCEVQQPSWQQNERTNERGNNRLKQAT